MKPRFDSLALQFSVAPRESRFEAMDDSFTYVCHQRTSFDLFHSKLATLLL